MIEDYTPGVLYYRGDVSYTAVYNNLGSSGTQVKVNVSGPVYGYDHAYAKTETQKRSIYIESDSTNYYIEETPTYTSYKDLQYGANEPWAISFSGNYKELSRGEGTLLYTIDVGAPTLYEDEMSGSLSTQDVASIEQLPSVELSHIKGHAAETDIRKMYSLGIFTGNANSCSPSAVVTRGEYIAMVARALKIGRAHV